MSFLYLRSQHSTPSIYDTHLETRTRSKIFNRSKALDGIYATSKSCEYVEYSEHKKKRKTVKRRATFFRFEKFFPNSFFCFLDATVSLKSSNSFLSLQKFHFPGVKIMLIIYGQKIN